MKVVIDVCQNTDLVELLSFAKSRQMCVVGFPDNPELEFLRSEVPIAASWRTPGKKRSGFWESRKRFHQRSRKQHSPSHSSTSASGDEYYFASESGSPLATPSKNRHSKSTKWRKRRQTIPAENKAMCTKCGAYITSDRIFALMNHASAHSDFARYKCSACDYYHKSFMKVRTHIHLEHDGDPSIKQQDQMNNAERLRIKQIAHECFPSHVVNPSTCMNNVPINAQHSPVKTIQQNNCQPALVRSLFEPYLIFAPREKRQTL
ncbi:hypothetical protein ANCCAN_16936 [Ancylostoma caninum]|uniref:C2H2-type domain-containing protein n=1 Tax=Ancylostoma caninum TaxID=29170 RepID=A0A368G0D8_ANCCA|nr:hypothetical protein ANCCAN_16936 [Ancylostoma caninum]